MTRIKMHISKAKLPFYPPYEIKCRLQNGVSTAVIVLEDEILAIRQDDYCTVSDPYVEWVIDSAASCHVTPRKELFTS